MTDEAIQRAQDAEEHRTSYNAIMKASTEIGVPFCLAITMFFTGLVIRSGFLTSVLLAVAVYIFSHIVVKTFFSHH